MTFSWCLLWLESGRPSRSKCRHPIFRPDVTSENERPPCHSYWPSRSPFHGTGQRGRRESTGRPRLPRREPDRALRCRDEYNIACPSPSSVTLRTGHHRCAKSLFRTIVPLSLLPKKSRLCGDRFGWKAAASGATGPERDASDGWISPTEQYENACSIARHDNGPATCLQAVWPRHRLRPQRPLLLVLAWARRRRKFDNAARVTVRGEPLLRIRSNARLISAPAK